ncbi:unnamed protein product [Aphanomyces euteiches]
MASATTTTPCKYAAYTATATTEAAFCDASQLTITVGYCVVNNQCKTIGDSSSSLIDHVGDVSGSKTPGLVINGGAVTSLKGLKFPPLQLAFVFQGKDTPEKTTLNDFPLDIEWPSSTAFYYTNLTTIPSNFSFANKARTNNLDLSHNMIGNLTNLNLSQTLHFTINDNKDVRISNVTFAAIDVFKAQNCTILQFDLSWDSLNALRKASTKTMAGSKYSIDKNACVNITKGTIEQLVIDGEGLYDVCVYPNATTTVAPTTTTTPSSPSIPPGGAGGLAQSTDSGSSTTGRDVGVAIGCLAVVLLLVFFIRRHFKKAKAPELVKEDVTSHGTFGHTTYGEVESPYEVTSESQMMQYLDWEDLKQYRIENVQKKKLLGHGGFGEVWLGTYEGQPVAIKTLTHGALKSIEQIQKFINEVKLLARLTNPYIVAFLGASWTQLHSIELVLEYMDMGDLYDFLRKKSPDWTWTHKARCATDIIHGLAYLHSQKIIHRDVKSRNVLLDSTKPSKLSDFGVSREVHSKTMTQEVGTYRWAAPEILNGGRFTVAADIFSFGMVLSEMDTHEIPYHNVRDEAGDALLEVAIVVKVVVGELRPKLTPTCPPEIREIINDCLQLDPLKRPTAAELVERMSQLRF